MKTSRLKIAFGLSVMITLLSCSEQDNLATDQISEKWVNIEAAANSKATFEIRSDAKWTLVSSAEWLDFTLRSNGNNSTTVTLTAEQNDEMDVRTTEIIASAPGTTPITIRLTQKCRPYHSIDYKAFGGPLPKKDLAILFASGLVTTPTTAERVVSISPDGSEMFFTRIGDQGPRIYRSAYRNRNWQAAELASFSLNNIATEPCISPNGNILFFISATPEHPSPDIWMSQHSKNGWGSPTRLDENVNTSGEEWHPSVSANGDLYFASTKAGGSGNADLYFSKFENGNYTMSQNLGAAINTASNEWDPYVSPEGEYIIFKSDRPGGLGGMDMYITLKKNGNWTTPQNLGAPINTSINDDAGDVTPDGKYLIFARESFGVMDVYWIHMDALKGFIKK